MLDIARNLSASASVHALTGSSQPGAVPPLVPLGATAPRPDAGRAAAAHPDAAVIELAGRVKALAARELRLVLRCVEIEDAVYKVMPPRPERAEGTLHLAYQHTVDDDGTRVTTIREPAGWQAEAAANREAHEAALAERERHERAEEVRRGLPRWMKLRERAVPRLERWGLQLAAMAPTTRAGLAAKAAAVNAIVENGELPNGWHQTLAIAVSRDAVRILGAAADALAGQEAVDPFSGYFAEIMGLQATIAAVEDGTPESEAAWDRWKEIDGLVLGSQPTTLAGAVGALELARREHHQFSIEDSKPDEIGTDDRLIQHALVGALAVLRPLADRGAPPQANLRPAPLPTGILAGRYPVGATREEIETYRTFLDMELRYLNWEIYGQTEGRLHYWLDNPAAQLHGSREPAASTRAVPVLTLLGIMPTIGVDGRAQAEGLAQAASAA